MTREDAEAWAADAEVDLLFANGFDDAIVGIGQRFHDYFVVYDYRRVITELVGQGMSEEDAVEYLEFNVVGAWVGEATPCFVTTEDPDAHS